ncbi:MAG: NUDIX hydrolase [Hahellaceae bacterium]|nr:NUDIX hydrolase [Hahellaceae bacterium]MCP5211421.1 NUDIX hydrolase [Hahellaceae bacterium]
MPILNHPDQSLIPSATVVLCHQDNSSSPSFNVLLLKRNSKLHTHGGSWVFPGGKIDPADYQSADLSHNQPEDFNYFRFDESQQTTIAKHAAVREAQEEAGVELAAHSLHLISRWITPETLKKRFDTRFFITETTTPHIEIDGGEIHEAMWISPANALVQYKRGLMILPPPTFITLTCLMNYTSLTDALRCMPHQCRSYRPKLVTLGGELCSVYEEDAAYNLSSENHCKQAIQEGHRQHRLIMRQGDFQYIDQTFATNKSNK